MTIIEHKGYLTNARVISLIKSYAKENKLGCISGDKEIKLFNEDNGDTNFSVTLNENSIELTVNNLETNNLIYEIEKLAKSAYITGSLIENLKIINASYKFNRVAKHDVSLIMLDYSYNEYDFIITIQIINDAITATPHVKDGSELPYAITHRIISDLSDAVKSIKF
ncbi:hypothetical protein [Pedobacter sp. MR2016-24]|uniref:hypothetical protein n=1 Tax=Pedobacter sp. MR2016-24 TaxID=2994466 RepID=UPI002246E7E2|nr:hypothetical protein [Pedobacter sp. MR2016-24]MCX2486585.1 hypothetical protein [Pedobacter sp. MR2016-24]